VISATVLIFAQGLHYLSGMFPVSNLSEINHA